MEETFLTAFSVYENIYFYTLKIFRSRYCFFLDGTLRFFIVLVRQLLNARPVACRSVIAQEVAVNPNEWNANLPEAGATGWDNGPPTPDPPARGDSGSRFNLPMYR